VTKVDELIVTKLMCWSEEKLEMNFIETDRRAIRQIPSKDFLRMNGHGQRREMGFFQSTQHIAYSHLYNRLPSLQGREKIIMHVGKIYGDYRYHRKFDVFGGES
jgi:hypothetical protein